MWQHKTRKPKIIPTTDKNKLKAQTNLAKPWMKETQAKMDDPGPQGPFHMYLQAQVRHALTIQETEHMVQGLRLQTSFFQMYCDAHICVTRAKHTWQCNVIQEETKRTEEKEEAGYRSPTSSILRVLQKINKTKTLEGETVMSAPPFFQSAGRGYLKFWGEDDGPTVVVWEKLSESEQEHGQVEGLGGLVQVDEKRRRATPVWSRWKRNLLKPQQASQIQSRREDG